MNDQHDELWLDHILTKAAWPEPSDDLHARIMQRAGRDALAQARRERMRWSAYAAALLMGGFIAGFLYPASGISSAGTTDAAYYSDSNFEYSNILGS